MGELVFTAPSQRWSEQLWLEERALVGCLTSSAVHELNNVLATLQTNAYLLRDAAVPAQRELLDEVEAAVDEGILQVQSLRALSGHKLTGPPTRNVGFWLSALRVSFGQSFPSHDCLLTAPTEVGDYWLEAPICERIVFACFTLLVGALPVAGGQIRLNAGRLPAADEATGDNGSLLLDVCARGPVNSHSAVAAWRAWLDTTPVTRLAAALSERCRGALAVLGGSDPDVGFRVTLPLLQQEQAQAAMQRAAKLEAGKK